MTDVATEPLVERRSLAVLYLVRAGFAAVWIAVVLAGTPVAGGRGIGVALALLLAVYPASDAVAIAVDLRRNPGRRLQPPQLANLLASAVAAAVVLVASPAGIRPVLAVFGGWAIVSGAAQLVIGVERLPSSASHWLMIVSGGGSMLASASFFGWSGTPTDGLATLTQYAAGGAVWYLFTSVWLFRTDRSRRRPEGSRRYSRGREHLG